MTAREIFTIGQPVTMSARGHQILRSGRAKSVITGVVTGFGRRPELVWIRRDGIKTAAAYHMDFWEPSQERQETR